MINGKLATSLTAYGKANQDNWDEFLPSCLVAYRTSTTSRMALRPFTCCMEEKSDFSWTLASFLPVKCRLPTQNTAA